VDFRSLPEESVLPADALATLQEKWSDRRDSGFGQEVRFFDFEANGKPFTQVAVVLTPERPLLVDGRRVVVIASEGGHDNGREFIVDTAGEEGAGPWLARRGVTFIALCRLGRWNFLSDDPLGSWIDVPLDRRMPVFHRGQAAHWSPDDFITVGAEGVSSPTGSPLCRLPREGTELEDHMLALTPEVALQGFEMAAAACLGETPDDQLLRLYWGFSTGATYLWSFAKRRPPDGVLGYGSAGIPFGHFASRAARDEFGWLYDRSALRVRQRGLSDFDFYNGHLQGEERERHWQAALHSPQFKSYEDTFMFYNVAAQSEALCRLWNKPFLPEAVRQRGQSDLLRANLDLAFPDRSLASVKVLDVFGTRDQILPPPVARANAQEIRPFSSDYRLLFLDGYWHSVSRRHVEAFGAVWLEAATQGLFTPEHR